MDPGSQLPDAALERLSTLVAAVDAAESGDFAWRAHTRIHFLRNFTIEPIEPYLKYFLMRSGVKPSVTYGGYDTMSQEVLDPTSMLHSQHPDVIVLSLMLDALDAESGSATWSSEGSRTRISELTRQLLERTTARVVLHTICRPASSAIDTHPGKEWQLELDALNATIAELESRHPDRLAISDWKGMIDAAGFKASVDARFWRHSQAPFRPSILKPIAEDLARIAMLPRPHSRKCLILDCDNTLWGGVVGEDGIDGIRLAPDDSTGAAFLKLQGTVIELQERGIMIALCSKNNEQDVWQVLDTHPHNLLSRRHIVAWRINWENKAQNVVAIAAELNIGTDSLVFADDNPRECELIRQLLPEVAVIQIPENLVDHPDLLTRDGLFAAQPHSKEDERRTQMYQEDAVRRSSKEAFSDLTVYLESLGTEAIVRSARSSDIPRAAQLSSKTNQFNLTTKRYSEDDIQAFGDDPSKAVFVMSARDRFGDLGTIAVLIAERHGAIAHIDSFLMSCRALSRQLEFAFADVCMTVLEERWNVQSWQAKYLPTRKNTQVADFWDRAGFTLKSTDNGEKTYTMQGRRRPKDYQNILKIEVE